MATSTALHRLDLLCQIAAWHRSTNALSFIWSLRQYWRCLGRRTVMCRLFVGISELEQRGLAVGQPKERNADREIVTGETRRHRDRSRVYQKCVQRRYAARSHIRGIDAVIDEARLVLHRLVHDGVELVVRHHLGDRDHQFVASPNVVDVACSIEWRQGRLVSSYIWRRKALLDIGRVDDVRARFEGRAGIAGEVAYQRSVRLNR